MKLNLETADGIVKMTLAIMLLIFYFLGMISGPFALVLVILSFGVVAIFITKFVWSQIRDE